MTRKEELIEAVHGNALLIPLVNDMVYLEEQLEYLQTLPKIRIEELTPFRKEVLSRLMEIPYGETVTYGEIALEIAQKRSTTGRMSAQAVGGAVGWNPICIMIPCHRVIGADGALTGYGGGIENKRWLLVHEGIL